MSHIPGNLTVTANHNASATTLADALVAGAQVGLGAAIAAGGPIGGARAIAGPNLDLDGNVSVLANTDSVANTKASASKSGALVSGLAVDQETQRQLTRLAQIAGLAPMLFPAFDQNPVLTLIDQSPVSDIQVGAAAAIALGAGRPASVASIGDNATITAGGNVAVTASIDFDSDADADALSVGGTVGVGVFAAGNYSEAEHIAAIGEGASVTANSISIITVGENDLPYDYTANAASIAAGLGGNIAGSLAVKAMRNHTAARIGENASVTSDTNLDLLASLRRDGTAFVDAGRVRSVTRAGEAAFSVVLAAGAAAAGSVTLEGDVTEAVIGQGAVVNAPSGVEVRAKGLHDFDDQAVGGSLSLAFAAAVGAAFDYTNSRVTALIDGGSVTASSGPINVIADTDARYDPNALGLAAAGLIAVAGSLTANVISNTTQAGIDGSGLATADTISVSARDDSVLDLDAGSLSVSFVGAAGASVAANIMPNTVEAFVGGAAVTTEVEGVDISARSDYSVDADALGLSVAGLVAGVGSITVNELSNTTDASIRSGATIISATDVLVRASDTSAVQADSVGLALSLGPGVGASFASNEVGAPVRAGISGATVTTQSGNVDISANPSLDVDALALGFAAGLIGGVGQATINEASNSTHPFVDNGATITSAKDVLIQARDNSNLNADSGGAAAGALLGAAGSFTSNKAASTIRASIGGAQTRITAPGMVDVEAKSDPILSSLAVALSLSGQVAVGGGAAVNQTANEAQAAVSDGAAVNATRVSIHAISSPAPLSLATGFAGALVTGGVMVSESVLGDSSRAQATGQITAEQLDVLADATRTPGGGASFANFSFFSGEVGFVGARITGDTEAFIGAESEIVINDNGNVTVAATSTDIADSDIVDVNFAANQLGAMATSAVIATNTRAHVDGMVSANNLSVSAAGSPTADATTLIIKAALLGLSPIGEIKKIEKEFAKISGQDAPLPIPIVVPFATQAIAEIGSNFEAYLGTGADINTQGALSLTATSTNTARADSSGGGTVLIDLLKSQSNARAGGSTKVHIDEGVSINVKSLTTSASANNTATADAHFGGVAGFDWEEADVIATADHNVLAYLGPALGQKPDLALAGNLVVATGGIALSATSTSTALVDNIDIEVAAVTVDHVNPQATAAGSTRAHAGGRFTVEADGLTLLADSSNTATSEALRIEFDAVDADLSTKSVVTSHVTESFVGRGDISLTGGALNMQATSQNKALLDQTEPVDSAGVGASVDVVSVADAGGSTSAFVAQGAKINAGGLSATAASTNTAQGDAISIEISGVAVNIPKKSAATQHVTEAFVGEKADVTVNGGELSIAATSANEATAGEMAIDLAGVSAAEVSPKAEAAGATRAFVREGALITATGFALSANATNTATAGVTLVGISGLDIDAIEPSAKTTHAVEAYFESAATPALKAPVPGLISVPVANMVTVKATSTNTAQADETGVQIGGVAISALTPKATAGGSTRAYVAEGATVRASDLTATAQANNTADAGAVLVEISGVGVGIAEPAAKTTHAAAAHFGPAAGTSPSVSLTSSVTANNITLDAKSTNTATADVTNVGVGLVTVGVLSPSADAKSGQTAVGALAGGASLADANVSGITGTHQIGVEGMDLAASNGTHQLYLDLTSSFSGAHQLLGAGGALGFFAAPSGDGMVTATATGSAGGFVGVKGTEADALSAPNIATSVGTGATVLAGNNFSIVTNSHGNASALACNSAGGFIAVGGGDAAVVVSNTNNVSIGNAATIEAGGNLVVQAQTFNTGGVTGDSAEGGFLGFADADAIAAMQHTTTIEVGQNVQLNAGKDLQLHSASSTEANARAVADRAGLGFDGDAVANILTPAALTQVNVSANALLEARRVMLEAQVARVKASAIGDADGDGFIANTDAAANVSVASTADVTIQSGAAITGTDHVGITARHDELDTNASANSESFNVGGDTDAEAVNVQTSSSVVNAAAGAQITTGNLLATADPLVETFARVTRARVHADSDGGIFDIGDEDEVRSVTAARNIAFDADVLILPVAVLEVDENAEVVQAANVTIQDSDGETLGPVQSAVIDVNDIAPVGAVKFKDSADLANAPWFTPGIIAGTQSTFDFQETSESVRITNRSTKDLKINKISAANITEKPQVIIEVQQVDFEFDVVHSFKPTEVEIQNLATSDKPGIILNGLIENPIGSTTILNKRGDILSNGTQAIVRSRTLDMDAALAPATASPLVHILGPINSSTSASGQVYIDTNGNMDVQEVAGDLRVALVRSTTGNVTLFAPGSVLDVEQDTAADVVGNTITMESLGGTIGQLANPLEIDSSFSSSGRLLTALAPLEIAIREVTDDLRVNKVEVGDAGDIALAVLDSDNLQNENLLVGAGKTVRTPNGTITLTAGDDISLAGIVSNFGSAPIFIRGDQDPIDPEPGGAGVDTRFGSMITISVTIGPSDATFVDRRGGADDDVISATGVAVVMSIVGGLGDDHITGSSNRNVIWGGATALDRDHFFSPTAVFDLPPRFCEVSQAYPYVLGEDPCFDPPRGCSGRRH